MHVQALRHLYENALADVETWADVVLPKQEKKCKTQLAASVVWTAQLCAQSNSSHTHDL